MKSDIIYMNKYYKWINKEGETILIHVIGFSEEKNIGTADYFNFMLNIKNLFQKKTILKLLKTNLII